MLRIKGALMFAGLALMLSQAPRAEALQGKGGGKEQGQAGDKGQGKGKGQQKEKGPDKADKQHDAPGRSDARASGATIKGKSDRAVTAGKDKGRGARGKFVRASSVSSMPGSLRSHAASGRVKSVVAAGALAHAYARGRGDDFRIDENGNRMRIINRRGEPLVDLDDRNAENLGRWHVDVLDDDVREGAPSFCRSGAGHPVWGREWCVNKGFGLGHYDDYRWGRTTDVGDIVFPRTGIGNVLGTLALSNLLGSTTFNRLALHAVTLGLVEPLTGRWVADQGGPQVLMVNSGRYPVAEMVDTNRDFRIEDLLVALLPW